MSVYFILKKYYTFYCVNEAEAEAA